MFDALSARLSAALKKLTGRGVLREKDLDTALTEIRQALLEADVNVKVAKEFTQRIRARLAGAESLPALTAGQQVVKAVHDELAEVLGGKREELRPAKQPPAVVMLVGLQGAGKTTTAIKLALLGRREGRKPMVAALDRRRPAAAEQLRVLAGRDQVAFFEPAKEADAAAAATAAVAEARRQGLDLVVLDTAGRHQLDADLIAELARIKAALPAAEVLLVADAMTGQEAVSVGKAFNQAVGLDGAILTKLDGDARGGAALSLRQAAGVGIRFAGTGERPQDLEVFHADRMAARILGMGDVLSLVEKAQQSVDQSAAGEVERHLRAGQLSLDDFLVQIRQLRSLGPVTGVLGMLPGGGQLKQQVEAADPEAEMRRMESIILSMTVSERKHPELIDGRRRRRIALGSGTQVADVNRLLKARETMQALVKEFGKPGGKGLQKLLQGAPGAPGSKGGMRVW